MTEEEELVSGEGWISADSSFYGDEDEQHCQYIRADAFEPEFSWHTHKLDLNAVLSATRAHSRSVGIGTMEVDSTHGANPSESVTQIKHTHANEKASAFPLDRRAMEEARLMRLGKRKREPSPEPELFNPRQGCSDAWQLGESADDFIRRLPPRTTSVFPCAWIWAHNPYHNVCDKSASARVDEFRSRGDDLLDRSLQVRQRIQAQSLHGPKAALTKLLNQESKALQQRITDLAVECGILSGKWMLFPKLEDVTQVWKRVVQGVIDNRLGPTAKVAPDEGKPGDRLVCIYTKDFRDEDDVFRVLQELETMGLLSPGQSIYYKSDAFTYLDLYKQTATEYGLQASLYSSLKMMAAAKHSKAKPTPGKKQKTLNNYF